VRGNVAPAAGGARGPGRGLDVRQDSNVSTQPPDCGFHCDSGNETMIDATWAVDRKRSPFGFHGKSVDVVTRSGDRVNR